MPLNALKDLKLVGVSQSDPKANKLESSTGGALGKSHAGAGSANRQVILPRHREAVERFFARPKDAASDKK